MLGTGALDDLGEVVGPPEDGRAAAGHEILRRRTGVDEADRAQAQLGLLVEPALDLGADAAGADDQGAACRSARSTRARRCVMPRT